MKNKNNMETDLRTWNYEAALLADLMTVNPSLSQIEDCRRCHSDYLAGELQDCDADRMLAEETAG